MLRGIESGRAMRTSLDRCYKIYLYLSFQNDRSKGTKDCLGIESLQPGRNNQVTQGTLLIKDSSTGGRGLQNCCFFEEL